MEVFLKGIAEGWDVRPHPWGFATYDPTAKYYDFRKHPELIREKLEDFKPWEKYKSVRDFYNFLEWVNNDKSPLESSDCRMPGPEPSVNKIKPFPLMLGGRLMIHFHDIRLNLTDDVSGWLFSRAHSLKVPLYKASQHIEWLGKQSEDALNSLSTNDSQSQIWIYYLPAFYKFAPFTKDAKKYGYQVAYQFYTFGNKEEEQFSKFSIIVNALHSSLMKIAPKVTELNQA